MRLDITRALRTFVLGAWAAFFIWLILSDEIYRYIGPRTYWVVWFGAAALVAAFLSQLIGIRSAPVEHPPSSQQLLGLVAVLVPILVLAFIPAPKLGALAASNKTSGGIATATALQAPAARPGQEVSFTEIDYASESEEYAASLGITDGYPVDLTGFVTHPEDLQGETFALTRFSIFCCAADVVPHSVTVDPSKTAVTDFQDDTWLRVRGELAKVGAEYVLQAEDITEVEEPDDPYI